MFPCDSCRFYQLEEVPVDPFSDHPTGETTEAWMCVTGDGDVCPVKPEEYPAVVPCPRCGRDCDGYGILEGIPVCPACDAGVL